MLGDSPHSMYRPRAFLFLNDPPLTAMNTLRTDASMVQVAAEPG